MTETELNPKGIHTKRFHIVNKDCQLIADVLLFEPLTKPSDVQVGRLYDLDMQEITLQDPAYSALKNHVKTLMEKKIENRTLSLT